MTVYSEPLSSGQLRDFLDAHCPSTFQIPLKTLLDFGKQLFTANWTIQEGQGRPLTKGVGTPTPLSDLFRRWSSPWNFNRFSAPDANSCAGCHNIPIAGGPGDIVANVFVLGQRFDSVTMDHNDAILTRGALDESGNFVNALNFADSRASAFESPASGPHVRNRGLRIGMCCK